MAYIRLCGFFYRVQGNDFIIPQSSISIQLLVFYPGAGYPNSIICNTIVHYEQ